MVAAGTLKSCHQLRNPGQKLRTNALVNVSRVRACAMLHIYGVRGVRE